MIVSRPPLVSVRSGDSRGPMRRAHEAVTAMLAAIQHGSSTRRKESHEPLDPSYSQG